MTADFHRPHRFLRARRSYRSSRQVNLIAVRDVSNVSMGRPFIADVMSLFWNREEGRVRALWRILLQGALMFALGVLPILLIAEPLTALHKRGLFLPGYDHDAYDRVINMMVGPLLAAAVIGSIAIAGRWLDRRPFVGFTGAVDRSWWRHLALGFASGAVLMALVFLVELAAGWIVVTGSLAVNVAGLPLGLALAFPVVKALCVGPYEEFLSRGYHLRNISEGTNLVGGVILSSALFALLHLTNEGSTALSTLGLFVNALLFAAAVLMTGRLSTAIGLHMAWNLFQGVVFGFPVSGDKEGASIIAIRQLGPRWLTGGDFGPEAGVIGICASLLGIALFAWAKWVTRPRDAIA